MLGNLMKYCSSNADQLYTGTMTFPSCAPTSWALFTPAALEDSNIQANSYSDDTWLTL